MWLFASHLSRYVVVICVCFPFILYFMSVYKRENPAYSDSISPFNHYWTHPTPTHSPRHRYGIQATVTLLPIITRTHPRCVPSPCPVLMGSSQALMMGTGTRVYHIMPPVVWWAGWGLGFVTACTGCFLSGYFVVLSVQTIAPFPQCCSTCSTCMPYTYNTRAFFLMHFSSEWWNENFSLLPWIVNAWLSTKNNKFV